MVDNDNNDGTDSVEDEIIDAHRSRNRQYVRTREILKQLIRQGYDDWEAYKSRHCKFIRCFGMFYKPLIFSQTIPRQ